MDRNAIRRRRRLLLTIVGAVLGVGLVVGVLFGRRWRREIVLGALASPNDAKVAWATKALKKKPDKGVRLLLAHLGRRGEQFDLRVADYLEGLGEAERLPVHLRVRAALAKLDDPVLATVGFARLLELPADALEPIVEQAVGLQDLALHRAAMACARLDPETSRERAVSLLEKGAAPPRRLGLALLGALGAEDDLPLIRSGLTDREPSVRAEAVHDLALVAGRQALPELAPLLGDPEATVRLAVLAAAVTVGGSEDGRLLLPALEDGAEGVRTQAALALASLGAREQAQAVASLAADPSPSVRGAVAAALGTWCDDDRIFADLLRLAGDDSSLVARVAYRVLVDSRRRDVLPFFISELSNQRPSWALDPLPGEAVGSEGRPVPFGALASCALRWLTGKEFGYHWRASVEDRQEAQERWRAWLAAAGKRDDVTHAPQPEGLMNYEQLLRSMPWPPRRP